MWVVFAPVAHAIGVCVAVEILSTAIFLQPALSCSGSADTPALWFGTVAVAAANARVNMEAMATMGAWLGLVVMFVHHPLADNPSRWSCRGTMPA